MGKLIIISSSFLLTILCFLSIYVFHNILFPKLNNTYVIAAFGASAVLAFSDNCKSSYSFKNMFLGAVIGAASGVLFNVVNIDKSISIILAVSISVMIMNVVDIKYPPGGAIALIPVLSGSEIDSLGFYFIIYPVLTGITILYFFSKLQILINNKLNKLWRV